MDNRKVWKGDFCCCQFFVFFSELYAHYYLIQPQLFCDNISFNFKKKIWIKFFDDIHHIENVSQNKFDHDTTEAVAVIENLKKNLPERVIRLSNQYIYCGQAISAMQSYEANEITVWRFQGVSNTVLFIDVRKRDFIRLKVDIITIYSQFTPFIQYLIFKKMSILEQMNDNI